MKDIVLHAVNFDKNEIQRIEIDYAGVTGIQSCRIDAPHGWMGINKTLGVISCARIEYLGQQILVLESFCQVVILLGGTIMVESYHSGIRAATEGYMEIKESIRGAFLKEVPVS